MDLPGFRDDLVTPGRRWRLWIDEDWLRGGDRLVERIRSEIGRSDAAVLLCGASFFGSEFIRNIELPAIRERAADLRFRLNWVPIAGGESWWPSFEFRDRLGLALLREPVSQPGPGVHGAEALVLRLRAALADAVDDDLHAARRSNIDAGYSLQALLAENANSRIWLGSDTTLGRQVTVTVAARPEVEPRFARMVQAGARLARHPSVLGIHRAQLERSPFWCVRQYVPGQTIRERLQVDRDGLPMPLALRVVATMANVLRFAHFRDDEGPAVLTRLRSSNVILQPPFDVPTMTPFVSIGDPAAELRSFDPVVHRAEDLVHVPPEYLWKPKEGTNPQIAEQYLLGMLAYESIGGAAAQAALDARANMLRQRLAVRPRLSLTDFKDAPLPGLVELRRHCPQVVADAVHRLLQPQPKARFADLQAVERQFQKFGQLRSLDLALVRESWRRLTAEPKGAAAFFAAFYERLLSVCATSRRVFQARLFDTTRIDGTRWRAQWSVVREAILLLIVHYEVDDESMPTLLDRLAAGHRKLGVTAEAYRNFGTVLVETVLACDRAGDPDALADAWQCVVQPGLTVLQASAALPPENDEGRSVIVEE
ncbi:MAG: hypothetical protein IPK26_10170 [Planctomycetes bacterium]|nr:hypothetical protein [Planctomycetota bacterium]